MLDATQGTKDAASTAGVPAGPDQAGFARGMRWFSSCALPCPSGDLACSTSAYCEDIQKLLQELRFATKARSQPETSCPMSCQSGALC